MKTMGIVFSNIYDSTFGDLTNRRTVASLPFGGRYRQIDFVLSNMSNSSIYNIGIITKYNYLSLMDHIGDSSDWDLNRKNEGIHIIPPFSAGSTRVYKGKMEALYCAVGFIDDKRYENVVLCDSNVLCNINFREVIDHHTKSGANITIVAVKENGDNRHAQPLVASCDKDNKVTELLVNSVAPKGFYSGIGMFVINREFLVKAIKESYSKGYVQFERDFLLKKFNDEKINVSLFEFNGIYLRNEDIQKYYKNNMALLDKKIRDGLFIKERPVLTKVRDETPTNYKDGCVVENSLIADGCTIEGTVKNSILFRGVSIKKGAVVEDSIVMQGTNIGENTRLFCVISDKNVKINDNVKLRGTKSHVVIINKGEII